MLFDLAIEPLTIALRSCKGIMESGEVKWSTRSSFTQLTICSAISNPDESLSFTLLLLSHLSRFSGYMFNINKTLSNKRQSRGP